MECESVTQEVLLRVDSILQNAKQIERPQFFFFGLEIIGHGNPDNNLESPCTIRYYIIQHNTRFELNYTRTNLAMSAHITVYVYCTNGSKNIL
jgi:hypothetical protein